MPPNRFRKGETLERRPHSTGRWRLRENPTPINGCLRRLQALIMTHWVLGWSNPAWFHEWVTRPAHFFGSESTPQVTLQPRTIVLRTYIYIYIKIMYGYIYIYIHNVYNVFCRKQGRLPPNLVFLCFSFQSYLDLSLKQETRIVCPKQSSRLLWCPNLNKGKLVSRWWSVGSLCSAHINAMARCLKETAKSLTTGPPGFWCTRDR